jgi:hypothetical protein
MLLPPYDFDEFAGVSGSGPCHTHSGKLCVAKRSKHKKKAPKEPSCISLLNRLSQEAPTYTDQAGFLAYGSLLFCAFSCDCTMALAESLPAHSDRIARDFHPVLFYPAS